ncbi:hypothetical protein LWI29_016983 [Acer saccharum]|uniref:Uncharacterized protein n=1 Tax=Acer saccharum TaxID=4024 RepID=A0AA39TSW9_ACESA|nr:hypothetical protein LWI29_016983 [Acer saccharum]
MFWSMASPSLHGLVEDLMSLKAFLSSSPHTSSVPTCGESMVSSSSRGCNLGTGLSSTTVFGDNLGTIGELRLNCRKSMLIEKLCKRLENQRESEEAEAKRLA